MTCPEALHSEKGLPKRSMLCHLSGLGLSPVFAITRDADQLADTDAIRSEGLFHL